MSLSALNYPPIIASASIAGFKLGIPYLDQFAMTSPWSTVRLATLLAYGVNVISVSRPGRLDGEASEMNDGELSPVSGKTLVAPAGWAFAIWGPIFLGELIHVSSLFALSEQSPITPLLRKTSGSFIAAQLFQSLWCAAFRPKYKGYYMYISSGLLAATGYSLSKAHESFTDYNHNIPMVYSNFQYAVFFFPLALHFGWVTAATLVNLNGAISKREGVKSKVVAIAGHLSVLVASSLGVYLTFQRKAPVFGGVISWALSAVADSMKKRLERKQKIVEALNNKKKKNDGKLVDIDEDKMMVGLNGLETQLLLSRVGAWISAAASLFVTGLYLGRDSKKLDGFSSL